MGNALSSQEPVQEQVRAQERERPRARAQARDGNKNEAQVQAEAAAEEQRANEEAQRKVEEELPMAQADAARREELQSELVRLQDRQAELVAEQERIKKANEVRKANEEANDRLMRQGTEATEHSYDVVLNFVSLLLGLGGISMYFSDTGKLRAERIVERHAIQETVKDKKLKQASLNARDRTQKRVDGPSISQGRSSFLSAACIGAYGVGKTLISSLLANRPVPHGHTIRTQGVSVLFNDQPDDDADIAYLDTAGKLTPVHIETQRTTAMFLDESNQGRQTATNNAPLAPHLDYHAIARDDHQLLEMGITDKRATENFLQDFIVDCADVMMYFANRIQSQDQLQVQSLLDEIEACNENEGKPAKKLIIVHNWPEVNTYAELRAHIQADIVEAWPLPSVILPREGQVFESTPTIRTHSNKVDHFIFTRQHPTEDAHLGVRIRTAPEADGEDGTRVWRRWNDVSAEQLREVLVGFAHQTKRVIDFDLHTRLCETFCAKFQQYFTSRELNSRGNGKYEVIGVSNAVHDELVKKASKGESGALPACEPVDYAARAKPLGHDMAKHNVINFAVKVNDEVFPLRHYAGSVSYHPYLKFLDIGRVVSDTLKEYVVVKNNDDKCYYVYIKQSDQADADGGSNISIKVNTANVEELLISCENETESKLEKHIREHFELEDIRLNELRGLERWSASIWCKEKLRARPAEEITDADEIKDSAWRKFKVLVAGGDDSDSDEDDHYLFGGDDVKSVGSSPDVSPRASPAPSAATGSSNKIG